MALTQVTYPDNEKILVGTSDDLKIHHNGTNSYIENGTGQLQIKVDEFRLLNNAGSENMIDASADGKVKLYHNASEKLKTESWGVEVTGTLETTEKVQVVNASGVGRVRIGSGNAAGVQILLDGDSNGDFSGSDYSYIEHNSDGDVVIGADNPAHDANCYIKVGAADEYQARFTAGGSAELRHANSKKFETLSSGVKITGALSFANTGQAISLHDDRKLHVGSGDDMEIFHDGTNTMIDNNTGELKISSGTLRLRADNGGCFNEAQTETAIDWAANGAVRLYYDNTKKFETNSGGVSVTGHCYFPDSNGTYFGAGEDLRIYHDGSNSYIRNYTGGLNITTADGSHVSILGGENMAETLARFDDNGAVKLYNDNTLRIETSSTGVTVNGVCDATCFTGDSGTSYGYTVNTSGDNHNVTDAWSHIDDDFEWALPSAGVYKLQASVRVRVWDENAWVAARYSGNAGDGPAQMLFESGEAQGDYNSSCHILWVYTATAADTVELQFKSSTSNTGTSIQSDPNGRNFLYWERIG